MFRPPEASAGLLRRRGPHGAEEQREAADRKRGGEGSKGNRGRSDRLEPQRRDPRPRRLGSGGPIPPSSWCPSNGAPGLAGGEGGGRAPAAGLEEESTPH